MPRACLALVVLRRLPSFTCLASICLQVEWLLSRGYEPGRVRNILTRPDIQVCCCMGLLLQASWLAAPLHSCIDSSEQCDALFALQGVDLSGAGLVSRLSWLRDRGFVFCPVTAIYVTRAGDEPAALELMLDACARQRHPGCTALDVARAAADEACEYGRIGCLQVLLERGWLKPSRVKLRDLLMLATHDKPRPEVVVWLVEHLTGPAAGVNAHKPGEHVFTYAARSGSVPVLQLLKERGAQRSCVSWETAAEGGCEDVLEYLRRERVRKPVAGGMVSRGWCTAYCAHGTIVQQTGDCGLCTL